MGGAIIFVLFLYPIYFKNVINLEAHSYELKNRRNHSTSTAKHFSMMQFLDKYHNYPDACRDTKIQLRFPMYGSVNTAIIRFISWQVQYSNFLIYPSSKLSWVFSALLFHKVESVELLWLYIWVLTKVRYVYS